MRFLVFNNVSGVKCTFRAPCCVDTGVAFLVTGSFAPLREMFFCNRTQQQGV